VLDLFSFLGAVWFYNRKKGTDYLFLFRQVTCNSWKGRGTAMNWK